MADDDISPAQPQGGLEPAHNPSGLAKKASPQANGWASHGPARLSQNGIIIIIIIIIIIMSYK